jgi:hypothetical protein
MSSALVGRSLPIVVMERTVDVLLTFPARESVANRPLISIARALMTRTLDTPLALSTVFMCKT